MSGMCVKLTFTFSAMGTCFPLVCTVSGLTEREMPTKKEFIHVTVPGLCIGGGGININNQEVGHLLFMQNTKGAEKKLFKLDQQEILVPGINYNVLSRMPALRNTAGCVYGGRSRL
jgi:hypothetical protein